MPCVPQRDAEEEPASFSPRGRQFEAKPMNHSGTISPRAASPTRFAGLNAQQGTNQMAQRAFSPTRVPATSPNPTPPATSPTRALSPARTAVTAPQPTATSNPIPAARAMSPTRIGAPATSNVSQSSSPNQYGGSDRPNSPARARLISRDRINPLPASPQPNLASLQASMGNLPPQPLPSPNQASCPQTRNISPNPYSNNQPASPQPGRAASPTRAASPGRAISPTRLRVRPFPHSKTNFDLEPRTRTTKGETNDSDPFIPHFTRRISENPSTSTQSRSSSTTPKNPKWSSKVITRFKFRSNLSLFSLQGGASRKTNDRISRYHNHHKTVLPLTRSAKKENYVIHVITWSSVN